MKNLITEAMTECVIMDKTRTPDGVGGFVVGYQEGAKFIAAVVFNASMEAKVAEANGVSSLYKVTAPLTATLDYHDVFKRLSDGKVFRVTSDSDDKVTPKRASFQFRQFDCEEWEIPE